MALDKSILGALIVSDLQASGDISPSASPADLTKTIEKWTTVAGSIISHFQSAGLILPGTFKDSTNAPITGIGKIS